MNRSVERMKALQYVKARLERKLASDKPRHVAQQGAMKQRLKEINAALAFHEAVAAKTKTRH